MKLNYQLAVQAARVMARYTGLTFSKPAETRRFGRDILRYVASYPVRNGDATRYLPTIAIQTVFPGIEFEEVKMSHRFDPMALPYGEAYVLAALITYLKPKRIFEVGTYLGSGTLLLAEHAGVDASVHTLDLPSDVNPDAHRDRIGERFIGTSAAQRITQLYGDSASFDFGPYSGQMDFVFLDAVHTYAYVRNDTQAALSMLSSTGTILWDDCSAAHPEVVRAISSFAPSLAIVRLAETRFAMYTRHPRARNWRPEESPN